MSAHSHTVIGKQVTALKQELFEANRRGDYNQEEAKKLQAEITKLRRQRDEAIAALRPFASLIADHHDRMPDDQPLFFINSNGFTVGDLRKASAAIKGVQS